MSEHVRRNSLPPREFDALSEIGDRYPVPPFRACAFVPRERARGGVGGLPDATISLEWDGQTQQFAVEYKASGSPQQIDLAIQQVRRYTRDTPDIAPLIVAPFLNPELLARLIEERVSGIDLSGNYAVTIPGRWLVVRSGSKNQFPSSALIKNVYRGKSALVVRALMLKGSFPTATAIMNDLTAFGAVTLPTISKVLTSLVCVLQIMSPSFSKFCHP